MLFFCMVSTGRKGGLSSLEPRYSGLQYISKNKYFFPNKLHYFKNIKIPKLFYVQNSWRKRLFKDDSCLVLLDRSFKNNRQFKKD